MLNELNTALIKPYVTRLQIARNDTDRTILGNLSEAYSVTRRIRLGGLSELSFRLPYTVDVYHKRRNNKNAGKVKEHRLVKFTGNHEVEWYLVTKVADVMEEDQDYQQVECSSLGMELGNRLIRNYQALSKNASQLLQDVLRDSNWSIGEVDASFDVKYRSFDVSSSTILDAVIQAAETFQAAIVWDTERRRVSFLNLEQVGSDKFLKVKYGKLLKNLSYEASGDEFCTRLKVNGKDGMSIVGVNPTGTNYLEDYSYFVARGDMTDGLRTALLNYRDLIASKQGAFAALLAQKNGLNETLGSRNSELTDLLTGLQIIEDNLSLANAMKSDSTALVAQRNSKNAQIAAKQQEIAAVQAQVDTATRNILSLKSELSIANHFTSLQIVEWNNYIIEKEWANEYISDETELLAAAKDAFAKMIEPKVVVNMSMINLYECVEEYRNWDKLEIGNLIYIQHEKLGVNIQAKIMEIDIDYESQDIQLTISNCKELLSDKERVIRDLYKAISTSTTVDGSKYKWDQAYSDVNDVSLVLQDKRRAISQSILASNNETVEIGRSGIRTFDLNDPKKYVVVQHGQIGLTRNGGNTWDTAIDANGIYAEKLIGQIIAGVNLTITNAGGSFLINQDGISATRADGKSQVVINPSSGIKIQSKSGDGWVDKLYADTDGRLTVDDITCNKLKINQPEIQQGDIVGSSINVGNGNFTVDKNGRVVAKDITISGGSIQWGAVTGAPTASWVNPAYIQETYIGETVISSPKIYGGYIEGVDIKGTSTVTGAIIKTSSENRRLQLDSAEFAQYNYSGNKVLKISSENSNPRIDFYDYGFGTTPLNSCIYSFNGMLITTDNYPLSLDVGTSEISFSASSINFNGANIVNHNITAKFV